jgi:hypothetical protein
MPAASFGSSALVGMSIGLFLIQKLVNKDVLSRADVSELADDALLKLEEFQSAFPDNLEDFEEARRLLGAIVRDYGNGSP